MKLKIIIIALILVLVSSCDKECILNYEIVETKYEIPFYETLNRMIKETEKKDFNRYERVNVNESEIPYIMRIINEQLKNDPRATENIRDNFCDYSVQIAGVYDRKHRTKKIYLSFDQGFIDFEEGKDEIMLDHSGNETRFLLVFDGGDSYFQAVINTKNNKLSILHINGEA